MGYFYMRSNKKLNDHANPHKKLDMDKLYQGYYHPKAFPQRTQDDLIFSLTFSPKLFAHPSITPGVNVGGSDSALRRKRSKSI